MLLASTQRSRHQLQGRQQAHHHAGQHRQHLQAFPTTTPEHPPCRFQRDGYRPTVDWEVREWHLQVNKQVPISGW